MTRPTLVAYQAAEREAAHEESRRGVVVHGVITLVVAVGLIVLNVVVATGFPWSVFAVGGMTVGLFMHWYFGYVRGDEFMQKHQRDIEHRVAA